MRNSWLGLPVVIIGTGGISKEVKLLIDTINNKNLFSFEVVGFISDDPERVGSLFLEHKVLGTDDEISEISKNYPLLGVIIPNGNPIIKKSIFEKLNPIGNICFPNIIHPEVSLSASIQQCLGIGNIFTAGVQLTTDISIGSFNLFNLNSTIGHDCKIGNFCVINPGATVSGAVTLNDEILIGTGANINQGVNLAKNTIIGSGSVVTKDLDEAGSYVGVPAKRIK